ncbi:LysM domain-containing protein [Lasiodiplodia hormozganensis]|uniref:LysM domain-containing protein n=1 Tax=Lasiodiplodia hormozganensis TaxID=869390 RepID=A0AA40CQY8_9PEZI|nr:LysM domain-containing protein [Lasiodiplodia hormozganensis]
MADLQCIPVVFTFRPGNYYNDTLLKSACTPDCDKSLESWEAGIFGNCHDVPWTDAYNESAPIETVPNLVRYNYNQTCRMDSGRYCNAVLGAAAASGGGGNSSACDLCAVKALQFAAGSPYYDGSMLQAQSVYQQLTSSCGVTGLPLSTTTLSFLTSTSTTPSPTPTCAGKTYSIQSGDDCHSIAKSQGIGTMWLMTDNNLPAWCNDFPTTGDLCLVNTCSVYTVQQNDTCDSMAAANSISTVQLHAWNPSINAGCSNLNSSIGFEVCINEPGQKYITPNETFTATTATTPAPVPTNVADGTNTECGQYYQAVAGDYCNLLTLKFGISLEDFIFLNPAINENCTNLYADESYCVEAVGDINTYSGRPGYVTATPTYSMIPWDSWPDATFTPNTTTSTGLPLASGTRRDCNIYMDGDDYQFPDAAVDGTTQCDIVAGFWGISVTDLTYWNPSLNASSANCSLSTGLSYCAIWVDVPAPAIPTTTSAPIRDGAVANCTYYYDVEAGLTCQDVLDYTCLTIAQFYAMNPAVGADCSGLWLGYQYCVRTDDYVDLIGCSDGDDNSTTTTQTGTLTAPPTTGTQTGTAVPSTTAPGPTQTGQPANCNAWYIAQGKTTQPPPRNIYALSLTKRMTDGDSCASVETTYLISAAQFLAWNPAVSEDCSTGFWAGYAYCVGTTDAPVSTPAATTTTSAASTTTTAAVVPSPTQENSIVSNCNKYAQAAEGDYCSLFAEENGITAAELYAWNAVLGEDGSGCDTQFWLGYWYCIGVAAS